MTKKLTWEEIKRGYDQEWVELVEYDWPEEDIYPRSGIVRVHARDRAEFYRLVAIDTPRDSALLFVGKQSLPAGQVFSPGLRQVVSDRA